MVKRFAADAAVQASMRAEELLTEGDVDSAATRKWIVEVAAGGPSSRPITCRLTAMSVASAGFAIAPSPWASAKCPLQPSPPSCRRT